MKKLLQVFGALILLISSFVSAQTDCFPLEPPLDKLVLHPIKTNQYNQSIAGQLDGKAMNMYLLEFNNAIDQYASNDKIPADFTTYVKDVKSTAFYAKAVQMTNASADLTQLKNNILAQLGKSKDKNEINSLILWHYQVQIIEASDYYNQQNAAGKLGPRWKCALSIIGGAGTGALQGAAAGSVIPGFGTAAGAIVGGIFGGAVGAAAGC
ncbi:hypothetical protein [Chryseobacterium sp. Leaf394]|uniref:hypothetical protein n=1 Tax=Chryseobacterium sp. Leaf394 TaxID=1736361 RepID=UPI0006FF2C52|nr:hypothetical protein [Chryseobacterium sp. Leaf394]KQS93770.1 hypothetical protein ASG21_19820 [Chryseobacterium sp. Leaf394]